jgi:hypothetical protein
MRAHGLLIVAEQVGDVGHRHSLFAAGCVDHPIGLVAVFAECFEGGEVGFEPNSTL